VPASATGPSLRAPKKAKSWGPARIRRTYDALKAALRLSEVVSPDETGWRVDAERAWFRSLSESGIAMPGRSRINPTSGEGLWTPSPSTRGGLSRRGRIVLRAHGDLANCQRRRGEPLALVAERAGNDGIACSRRFRVSKPKLPIEVATAGKAAGRSG
jgi:hypothetical protein